MGAKVDLQNLGDSELSREIAAQIEHALSDKLGDWRVSIAGSRASENWEMRIEGPNGFERSYTLIDTAGEHVPDTIRRLVLQLVPAASS
ncbi:MAG: hypothetical protein ACRD3P_13275 [Terriglobales bacterium]